MAGLVARVHQLLAVHAVSVGGEACPSGTDIGLARFAEVSSAMQACLAVVAEVEAAREVDGHAHHGLLACGVGWGPVLVGPGGQVLGVPVARAVRLAVWAEGRGEVVISDAAREAWAAPEGLGVHGARGSAVQSLGFGFGHVADYR